MSMTGGDRRRESKTNQKGIRGYGRPFCFWVICCLQMLGITVGGALAFYFLYVLGGRESGSVWQAARELPMYLVVVGFFVNTVVTISYFQLYWPALISMGCTRRRTTLTIWAVSGGCALAVAVLAALTARFGWDQGSGRWEELLLILAGVMVGASALFIILGASVSQWGTVGLVVVMVIYLLLGAGAGFFVGMSGRGTDILALADSIFSALRYWPGVLGGGIALYGLSGVFAVTIKRKSEVRL